MDRTARHTLAALTAALLLAGPAFSAEPLKLPPKEKFHLFLLIGQSNMAGRGAIEEQDKVAHTAFVSSAGLHHKGDKVHFDAASYRELGRRCAQAYLKLTGDKETRPAERGPLWPGQAPTGDGTFEAANATITVYLPAPDRATGAAVVICPGGGYMRHVVDREGHPIARWLTEHGIAAVVLEYRLPQGRSFVPLLDAQRAVRMVRARAAEWHLQPNRIGIMGFSAGGHLASTAGTHFDDGDPKSADPVARVSCRPDFMILIYPVITMTEKTHSGSKRHLLGADPKPKAVRLFSNEKQVTDKTPPAFLAHAKDDVSVPPENSRMFRDALGAHNVSVEYLELPSGGHGLNGCQGPMWEAWKKKSLEWLAGQGIVPRGRKP